MRAQRLALLALLGALACGGADAGKPIPPAATGDSTAVDIAAELEQAVWNQSPPSWTTDARWALIRKVYDGAHYAPLWVGRDGPTATGRAMLDALCAALDEGIHPAAFVADSSAWDTTTSFALAQADLRISAAVLDYFTALAAGQVAPGTVDPAWRAPAPAPPADSQLARALRLPPGEAAGLFRPESPAYGELRAAFARYRLTAMSGDWMLSDTVRTLRSGVRDSAVVPLRRRLISSVDLAARESSSTLFDSTLVAAVRHAQRRLGLRPDGIVGPGTWHALIVPAAERARRVAANLERYRWLPRGGAGRALVLDEGAGRAELWVGPERRFVGQLRLGVPCPADVPLLADTVRRLERDSSGITLTLAGGLAMRLAPAASRAGGCALVEEFDDVAPLLTSDAAGPAVLYLLQPTAVASAAGGTAFRHDSGGRDDRLEAALTPILSRETPPACARRTTAVRRPPQAVPRSSGAEPRRPAPGRAGTVSPRRSH